MSISSLDLTHLFVLKRELILGKDKLDESIIFWLQKRIHELENKK